MPETITAAAPSASVAGEGAVASSVVESPSTTEEQPIGAPDSGTETAQPEADAGEPGAQPDQSTETQPEGDGRYLPNAIKALKESNPEAFKAAKGLFFENRAFKDNFPTVAEAARAKQTLELVGGEAGLTEMQSTMGEFKEVAQQFMNGDPAFITDLAETDPQAFASHVPTMLDTLRQLDAPLYNREMAKRIQAEHTAIGLRPALEQAYQLIQDGDKDKALELLGQLAGWHDKINSLAKQEDDPKYRKLQEELKKERQSNQQKGDQQFFDSYRTEATTAINSAATKLLDSYLKDSKIDDDLKAELRDSAVSLANKSLDANETYKKQRDLLFGRRDTQASVRFAVAQFQQALGTAIQEVIRKQARIVKAFGKQASLGSKAPDKTQPQKASAAPAGWTRIAKPPSPTEIDRNRTNAGMILNQKQAILKDGRKVTWAT